MTSKEVLTLQFGHYSNYVGTHWWNLQESNFEYGQNESPAEINHDVLFREGISPNGQVTFTPRLLLVDLRGSLKGLPELGKLYGEASTSSELVEWDTDGVEVIREEPEEQVPYQKDLASAQSLADYDLDEEVRTWSDFLYTRFHPRTVNIVKEYQSENDSVPFNIFPMGRNLWNASQFQEDFSDKIRNYIEECDNLQGFHVVLDAFDGFSGLSTSCIQEIRDEYTSKSIMAFPILKPQPPLHSILDNTIRYQAMKGGYVNALNLTLCLESLTENATLFTPLSLGDKNFKYFSENRQFHRVTYKEELPYHSSAILAAALDTFTLKHRLKSSGYTLRDLGADLAMHGRKMCAASVCLPLSINKSQDLIDCLDNWDGPLTKSITPNCELCNDRVMQLYTLRGIPETRLKKRHDQTGKQRDLAAYRCNSVKEMLTFYLSCNAHASATDVTVSTEPLRVKTPFPKIFDSKLDVNGDFNPHLKSPVATDSVPVLAGLHNGEFIGKTLESLINDVKTIKFERFHQFHTEGVDNDDFVECLDKLMSFKECYEDNYLL